MHTCMFKVCIRMYPHDCDYGFHMRMREYVHVLSECRYPFDPCVGG